MSERLRRRSRRMGSLSCRRILMSTNALSTRRTLFGLPFDPVTMREAVGWARHRWEARQGARIATVNSSILLEARSEEAVWEYVTRADLVVCDGMPLVWASQLAG